MLRSGNTWRIWHYFVENSRRHKADMKVADGRTNGHARSNMPWSRPSAIGYKYNAVDICIIMEEKYEKKTIIRIDTFSKYTSIFLCNNVSKSIGNWYSKVAGWNHGHIRRGNLETIHQDNWHSEAFTSSVLSHATTQVLIDYWLEIIQALPIPTSLPFAISISHITPHPTSIWMRIKCGINM